MKLDHRDEVRFWNNINIAKSGCWEWKLSPNPNGYGYFSLKGTQYRAHRIAYLITGRAIPQKYHVAHRCHNKICVNPWHLEAQTHKQNIMDGNCASARHARKTNCIYGHQLSGVNLVYLPKKNKRVCLKCRRRQNLAWYYQNKAHKEKYGG